MPNKEGISVLTKVKHRKRDSSGNPVGEANPNPILDTRIHDLQFPDSRIEEYATNMIAKNLFQQADEDGWESRIIEEFTDLRKDNAIAVSKEKGTYHNSTGIKQNVIMTKGQEVQVRWRDKSTSWISLKAIKEGDPLSLAELVVTMKVHNEPAFKWQINDALQQRIRIISRLKSNVIRKEKTKFRIQIPSSVEEAKIIDDANSNTLQQDAIEKEIKNSKVAFKLLSRGENTLPGYNEILYHLVFNVKLNMTYKARYVASGHLIDVPANMTYSSVVSRDMVRIRFLDAALNDLDILAGDIQNAFLFALIEEKFFFYTGDKWGADKDCVVVVIRALYGLKSSTLQFRNHLAATLSNKLGIKSCLADLDLWYKACTDSNGNEYYACILVYVDDLLIIDKKPMRFMVQVQSSFTVKKESIGSPN